jgi:sugar phosphate isomerase/epimerase
MTLPRISLAIDNCFAAKRWCEPAEWMRVVRDLGLQCVEASADNEIDPLYSTPGHLDDWLAEVRRESERTGVRVVNCYSGHGTYSTLGLGHHDPRVRAHLRDAWVRPMLRLAGRLNAGLGFFAHAFSEAVLRDPARYRSAYATLVADLRALAAAAREAGASTFGIEQMYTPHQVPWTLAGAEAFLRDLNAGGPGTPPAYLTIDTGHACGQARFLPPTDEAVARCVEDARAGRTDTLYLGPVECHAPIRRLAASGAASADVRAAIDALCVSHPHLFAAPGDGDPYRWLERFGAWSPIIHLQQTNGRESGHKNFTAEHNARGVIRPPDVIRALAASFSAPAPAGLPPPANHIYLTLEPFLPTAAHARAELEAIAESVAYWRRHVPRDGMALAEVLAASQALGGATLRAP